MAIGVFDSGIGGMTVVREIRKKYPLEKVIYFGDTLRVPYGNKTVDELIFLADHAVSFLISQGAEILIDACNTTSAVALPHLREKYDIPILGMIESGVDAALDVSKGKIGLIATEKTVSSKSYENALRDRAENLEIKTKSCPSLVGFVEAGDTSSLKLQKALRAYLDSMEECDTLILGCTHYPFLENQIRNVLGKNVEIIDPAVRAVEFLERHEFASNEGSSICFVSGDAEMFSRNLGSVYREHRFTEIISFDPIGGLHFHENNICNQK